MMLKDLQVRNAHPKRAKEDARWNHTESTINSQIEKLGKRRPIKPNKREDFNQMDVGTTHSQQETHGLKSREREG